MDSAGECAKHLGVCSGRQVRVEQAGQLGIVVDRIDYVDHLGNGAANRSNFA